MIPAGILAQSTRDLSKEIWITWGGTSGKYEGVFVNSFHPTDINYSHILKNAKGEDTEFRYFLGNYGGYEVYPQYHASGVLDIINRCEIQIETYVDDVEWFIEQWISLTSMVSTPAAMYVLGSRQGNSQYDLSFWGWSSGSTVIPQNVSYPVQTKMEITSDWFEVGQMTAYGQANIMPTSNFQFGRIRAIVIKLSPPPPQPVVLTSITVNPSTFNVSTGSTRQLAVTANYSNGSTANITNDATYNSSNSSVATVNSTGLVSGVSQGSATINISYEGETTSSSATITIPATLTSISVSPTSASIQVGYGRQLSVTAHYSDSSQVNITSLASYVRTNSNITVNSTGYITANSQGASGVNISYQGHTTSMSVTVTAAIAVTSISISPSSISMNVGSTRQLTVTAYYSDSSTANVTSSASYGTSNSSIATVNGSGLVIAGSSAGSVNITATYGGWSDGINVNVTAATVTSLSISPTSFSIAQGGTQQLAVTAHMSDSSTQTVTGSASYSSNQTGRATVSSSGLVTASNSGTGAVNITASYQGYSAVSNGTITAATVNSISVSPTSVSLPMGRTQQLAVTAHMSNGGTQTVTSSASYSSNNTGRATVSGGGLITAGNTTGAATITITYSGKSTTMSSTTTAAVVNSLSVSPSSFSVEVGSTQQLIVTAAMSNGTNQNVTLSATYTRTNTNITVSSGGLVAAVAAGSSNVNISYGGASTATTGITITNPVTLQSMVIEPSSIRQLAPGSQSGSSFSVRGYFSNGTHSILNTADLAAFMRFDESTIYNIAVYPDTGTTFTVYQEGPPYENFGVCYFDILYLGPLGTPPGAPLTVQVGY